jgi:hypothetical protein
MYLQIKKGILYTFCYLRYNPTDFTQDIIDFQCVNMFRLHHTQTKLEMQNCSITCRYAYQTNITLNVNVFYFTILHFQPNSIVFHTVHVNSTVIVPQICQFILGRFPRAQYKICVEDLNLPTEFYLSLIFRYYCNNWAH